MNCNELTPGLMVAHANRPEDLRTLLVAWMRTNRLAPFATDVLLVHSNVMAQWLKMALAADAGDGIECGCGIAAGIETLLPARFLWQVYRAFLGKNCVPNDSPLDKSRLVWRLLRILPEVIDKPGFEPLRGFLLRSTSAPTHTKSQPASATTTANSAHLIDSRKCYQLAQQLADLFDQYQVYRADWLGRWEAGDDQITFSRRPQPQPMPAQNGWQPLLWRILLDDVVKDQDANNQDANSEDVSRWGRAQVHQRFMELIKNAPPTQRPVGLPPRVIVFGVSSLPQQALEVLAAISPWSQVLLCVNNPAQHYWLDAVVDRDLLTKRSQRHARRTNVPESFVDAQIGSLFNPLLAAWGKQGRDYIALLEQFDSEQARSQYALYFEQIGQRIDLFEPNQPPAAGQTPLLLHQVQNLILDASPVAEISPKWRAIDPCADHSLRFHVAHSPLREVEILHDQLLAQFNSDTTLRPRDVVVMMPDIDAYAPFIEAVFGMHDHTDKRHIPYCLADRSRSKFDPLLNALRTLFDLPHSRLSATEVTGLLNVPAIQRRFAISEDEFANLSAWIRDSNIRWGLHGDHYSSFDLPADGAVIPNTWMFGLRRMLLGYAVGGSHGENGKLWHDIVPFDEVAGLGAVSLGRLIDLLEQIEITWRLLQTQQTAAEWEQSLLTLFEQFFDASDAEDALTINRLQEIVRQWAAMCAEARLTDPLEFVVVKDYILEQIEQVSRSQHFFAGAVTFGTLMPMRTIPFRIVCILGMDDGIFPHQSSAPDFDLMSQDYRPGDRSRRDDDRYLFLEALLAAREMLYISWVGYDIIDNSVRPASVLVGQLRDHIGAGWLLASAQQNTEPEATDLGAALVKSLTVEHPLQPFSLRYYASDNTSANANNGDTGSALFTYAQEWRAERLSQNDTATAATNTTATSTSKELMEAQLAPPERLKIYEPSESLQLAELINFFKNPVRAFTQKRFGIYYKLTDDQGVEHEPFELDGLERWIINDDLIRHSIANYKDRLNKLAAAQTHSEPSQAKLHHDGAELAKEYKEDQQPDHNGQLSAYIERPDHNGQLPASYKYPQIDLDIPKLYDDKLQRFIKSGKLPAKALGEIYATDISATIEKLLTYYGLWLATTSPSDFVANVELQIDVQELDATDKSVAVKLVDRLVDFRIASDGSFERCYLSASKLESGDNRYLAKLMPFWVEHLACQLSASTTTLIFSTAQEVKLKPVAAKRAEQLLKIYLHTWFEGMRRPIPFAIDTASAYVKSSNVVLPYSKKFIKTVLSGRVESIELSDDCKTLESYTKALRSTNAINAYEGGYRNLGELKSKPELALFYPNYSELIKAQCTPEGTAEFEWFASILLTQLSQSQE